MRRLIVVLRRDVGGVHRAGTPKKGGTLKVGILGGSSSDTVDANTPLTYVDNARLANLYDPLLTFDRNAQIEYDLAKSLTASKDAMTWTIELKPGIEFHDGTPFTSESVKYTLQRIATNNLTGAPLLLAADVKNIKILDKLSLQVPMHTPNAVFDQALASPWAFQMVPEGYDPKNPIGTGPFKYESFTPGQQSGFVRNDNYWDEGNRSSTSSDRRHQRRQREGNGLLSGQFDAIGESRSRRSR